MLVEIEGVRPALLTNVSYKFLNELRGFRHVFRHAYSYGLDNERVSAMMRKVLGQKYILISDLQTFRNTVAGFIEESDESPK
jgi:HepT-like protein